MSHTKKLIYFGASGCGKAYCKNTGILPDFFVDNDEKKWGKFFNGVEVKNPSILTSTNIKKLVITTSFLESVYPQILSLGVCKNLIEIPPKSMWSDRVFEEKETRVQAAKELNKIMKDFNKVFEGKNSLVAVGGTALGFMRDKDFIHWDDDIDLFAPIFTRSKLIEMLKNYEYFFEEKHESIMQAIVFFMPLLNGKKIPVSVDFFDNTKSSFKDTFEDYSWNWPTTMFSNCLKVEIHGKKMNIPNPASEYLEKVYGLEWFKPNPEFSYGDYAGNKKLNK